MSDDSIEQWFGSLPDSQKQVLEQVRRIIGSAVPDAVEEFKWSRPCYSLDGHLFCYLQSTKKHAVLGFQKGATLTDPNERLEGSGKEMRHIKLKSSDEIDEPYFRAMLQEAAAE